MINKAFPFDLALSNDKTDKKIFIDTVEEVLKEQLQKENTLGCRIHNCHMHVGSKKHLDEFVEAELLFHNSYYNKGFAVLTREFLKDRIKDYDRVSLVGYETFSELYLRETIELLQKMYPKKKIGYYVVETVEKNVRVRVGENIECDSEYFAFIVPINTTLTTHDKLMSAFDNYHVKEYKSHVEWESSCNLALIMVAPMPKNDYWEKCISDDVCNSVVLKSDKQAILSYLNKRSVYYFAFRELEWKDASHCVSCYPDYAGKALVEEQPIFEVNRESIVPMLQIGIDEVPYPLNMESREKSERNLARVVCLADYMAHRHIIRNGNHYQYHFDTQKFFEHVSRTEDSKLDIKKWLIKEVKSKIDQQTESEKSQIYFDFLVAPRHYSNAGIVQFVNDYVFNGTARVLYFEVGKEYRDNIRAKYSDFSRLVRNIATSKQKSCIRFHYVDDSIYLGTNFTRTKSLINSLIRFEDMYDKDIYDIQLFSSIIILLGRSSEETKKSYISNVDHFFEYVHLSVSPMRHHEDACTLCQLRTAYKVLYHHSATNRMAECCSKTCKNHKPHQVEKIDYHNTSSEKKLRLILRHLLAERLHNIWWIEKPIDTKTVNSEDSDEIYEMLKRFFKHIDSELRKYGEFSKQDIQVALVKIITRPFFTFHIRRRQAAFRFCIEKLDSILNKKKITTDDQALFGTLIKGLADMNANYLIRLSSINKILDFIDKNRTEFSEIEYYKAIKKIVGLSSDDSKSLLLEIILVTEREEDFFGKKLSDIKLDINDIQRLILYIENNEVLMDGLDKIYNQPSIKESEFPYYLKKFEKILKINCGDETDITSYIELRYFLENKKEGLEKIGEKINAFFKENLVQVFLRDEIKDVDITQERSIWERYYFLGTDNTESKAFYDKDNLIQLDWICSNMEKENEVLGKKEKSILNIMDTIFIWNDVCIVRIGNKKTDPLYFKFAIKNDGENQFFNNNKSKWFSVKVLLTLRREWIKFLKSINVTNVKRQLYDDKNRRALIIRKATNHQQKETYEGQDAAKKIWKVYEQVKNLDYTGEHAEEVVKFIEAYRILADKYMLFLSNQFISDMYRRVVCYQPEKFRIGSQKMGQNMRNFMQDIGYKDNGDGWLCYVMNMTNERGNDINLINGNMKVEIRCNISSFQNKRFYFLKTGGAKIPQYYLLMLVMAGNAGYHFQVADGSKKCIFEIVAEEQYLVFKNTIAETKVAEEICAEIEKSAMRKMSCPPWECQSSEQSITLWTLQQYFQRAKNDDRIKEVFGAQDDWIEIKVTQEHFIIRLRMLAER